MEIEILNEERLRAWCARLTIPEAGCQALVETAQAVQSDPQLAQIFATFYESTTIRGEWQRDWTELPADPYAQQVFGKRVSLFYLLAYMAGLPRAEREYQQRGIRMDIFDATLHDITFYYAEDSDVCGDWHFDHFPWLWRHLTCVLFRLGRLQFMLAPFESGVTAFRHSHNGQIILLGDPNLDLRADGHAEGAGEKPSGTQPWRPVFETRPDGWYGHPISPYGCVQPAPRFLPGSEWQPILQRGDTVLDIHIPRGKTLTAEDCSDSFRQAIEFFAWQYPEQVIHASYCHTWFFTPQLQKILPPESSIVRFQREFYLYPFPGRPGFLWTFVFGGKYPDRTNAPRDTSLRRAVLEWLERGDELFDLPGVMFHKPEEWGRQPYMRAWDAHPETFLSDAS